MVGQYYIAQSRIVKDGYCFPLFEILGIVWEYVQCFFYMVGKELEYIYNDSARLGSCNFVHWSKSKFFPWWCFRLAYGGSMSLATHVPMA